MNITLMYVFLWHRCSKRTDFHTPLGDPCGSDQPLIISGSEGGIIESPNYPNHYPNGASCSWKVIVGDGMVVKLDLDSHYAEFDVEKK